MRKHLLALVVILTAGTGCDNVEWGGMDFELSPPAATTRTATEEVETTPTGGPENFDGPLLLAGVRDGERADLVLVGEVHPGTLRYFPDPDFPQDVERLARMTEVGSEWVLFSEGVRVGRMTTEVSQTAPGYCGDRVSLSGVVELVPSAASAERFLALPADDAEGRPYEPYVSIQHDYDQRVGSLALATETLRERGATWPTRGVLDARDHIQAFQLRNARVESIAATFMHADELAVGPPGPQAYALFVMGAPNGDEYASDYLWYRAVDTEGKGAPRYFDHLDWDGDGQDEVLLDVLGANQRWFAALSEREGSWVRTFQDSCGSRSAG